MHIDLQAFRNPMRLQTLFYLLLLSMHDFLFIPIALKARVVCVKKISIYTYFFAVLRGYLH